MQVRIDRGTRAGNRPKLMEEKHGFDGRFLARIVSSSAKTRRAYSPEKNIALLEFKPDSIAQLINTWSLFIARHAPNVELLAGRSCLPRERHGRPTPRHTVPVRGNGASRLASCVRPIVGTRLLVHFAPLHLARSLNVMVFLLQLPL